MKKTRAPDLTDDRIARIVDSLDGWNGKLTWELLIAAVHAEMGITYSRFTLSEHARIAHAFALRKTALRGVASAGPRKSKDEAVLAALDRVEKYKAKVERLESENQLLLEQFLTWTVNAERGGVSIDMLNRPLAKPARERTKGKE